MCFPSSGIPEIRSSTVGCWLPLLPLSLPQQHPYWFCVLGMWEKGGPCPVSHFCPEGTSFPLPCLAGTYNNLTRQAACFLCAAGYYCPENTTSYSMNPCPAGFYCPKGEMGPGTRQSTGQAEIPFFLKARNNLCEQNLYVSVWFFSEKNSVF